MLVELIDYLKDLGLIMLPIIFGFITSTKIVHKWQIQKEKKEIKKKMLDEFNQSYYELLILYHSLYFKIRTHYTDKKALQKEFPTFKEAVIFPTDKEEYPSKKFADLTKPIINGRILFNKKSGIFWSGIILYFKNVADFGQEIDFLEEQFLRFDILFEKMIHSQSKDEFITSCKEFQKYHGLALQKCNMIRTMIVYEKIYDTDKGVAKSMFKVTKGFEIDPTISKSNL